VNSLIAIVLPPPHPCYHCEIPGEPLPWKRAGEGHFGKYNKSKGAQENIAWAVVAALPHLKRAPHSSLWGVRMRFFYSRGTPGDLDNLAKNVCDALQSVVWDNDSKVRLGFFVMVPTTTKRARTELLLYPLTIDELASWGEVPQ
jgi:Holliday junction resolvase RusA-like endonuclease